ASMKWPMRHLAMTGMVTASLMARIIAGSLARAMPPSRRICDGTRSRAMTAAAPASSASLACSGVVTSMMTPPFNISARPTLVTKVDFSMSDTPQGFGAGLAGAPFEGGDRAGEAPRALDDALDGLGAEGEAHAAAGAVLDGVEGARADEDAL